MSRAYKLTLYGLGAIAVVIVTVIVTLNIQHEQRRLTPEKLEAARRLWAAAQLWDYDVEVTVSGRTRGVYCVQVRGGRPVAGTMNGQPFDPPERARIWTMDELLYTILERDLENDAKPDSPSVYTQVEFDPHDGHLIHYLRSSALQHVTLDVRLERNDKVTR